MSYIKKHKLTSFIIFVFIVGVSLMYVAYNYFDIGSDLPVYGDRLDGIDKVLITDEQNKALETKLLEQPNVLNVNIHLSGKTYNVVILVGDNAPVAETKAYATLVSESLTPEQNNFYDVQVFLNKNYSCTLTAKGNADEEGKFTENVTVKFDTNLEDNEYVINYGMGNTEAKEYNSKGEFTITENGEYVIHGFTQDKFGEYTCSIKVIKTEATEGISLKETTVSSATFENFPIIGYKRKGSANFVWTKDR